MVEEVLPEELWDPYRRGEDGRRERVKLVLDGRPSTGDLLRSIALGVSSSERPPSSVIFLNERFGMTGKTSSAGFRGVRFLLGDPKGLAGRCVGDERRCPAPLNPGIDCALIMGGARAEVEDLDRRCPREKGEVFRGRYGREGPADIGDRGDCGVGSVHRRIFGGFPNSWMSYKGVACSRRTGKGEVLNSSNLSVSGTGSMLVGWCYDRLGGGDMKVERCCKKVEPRSTGRRFRKVHFLLWFE